MPTISEESPERRIEALVERGEERGCVNLSELLELAEKSFDAFITVDRNLAFQQSLPKFSIAVLILRAPSNRLSELRALIPRPGSKSSLRRVRPGNSHRPARAPRVGSRAAN
jgi:hypothetical protein